MCKCPKCKGDSVVLSTREIDSSVRRTRKCSACGFRWATYEGSLHEVAKQVAEFRAAVKELTNQFVVSAKRQRDLEAELVDVGNSLSALLRENGIDPEFQSIRDGAAA